MAIYARVAQHLAAAFRCRRLLGTAKARSTGPDAQPSTAEAILDADGRFVHAEGKAASKAARERIRAAAQSIATLRTQGRKLGGAALDGWSPLVGARWTLVDTFEENGRHYVVARENQARTESLDMLTDRERQVVLQAALGFSNKEIAYALGLADSTVRVLMARAANRIGVRTREELLSHPSLREIRADRAPGQS
jgi:DNA-binding CsgD family transcriptional regulator